MEVEVEVEVCRSASIIDNSKIVIVSNSNMCVVLYEKKVQETINSQST